MKNKKREIDESESLLEEDSTKYGEFVTSYFAWIPLDKQKKKAEQLDQMTKNKKVK